jgi:predicted nucleic acid-binding OB-fold protein
MGKSIEQRKKTLLKKIEALGILDIHVDGGHGFNLDTAEEVVKILEKHEKEYPPEYYAACNDFIKVVRERVWKHGDKFSTFYFNMSEVIFWELKNLNYKPKVCKEICEKILDVEKLFSVFQRQVNIA